MGEGVERKSRSGTKEMLVERLQESCGMLTRVHKVWKKVTCN